MDRDDALRKVKKLLQLSTSCNEHEAARAMHQAKVLAEKFNFELSDIDSKIVLSCFSERKSRFVQEWERELVSVISKAFNVGVIHWKGAVGCKSQWEFAGFGIGGEMASYTYDVLMLRLSEARKMYVNSLHGNMLKKNKTRRGDLFALGWVRAVRENVEDFAGYEPLSPEIRKYISDTTGDKSLITQDRTAKKPPASGDGDAQWKGYKAGENVTIMRPVENTKTPDEVRKLLDF